MERKVLDLKLVDILPNRFQPRIKFKEDQLTALAESIKNYGVLEPIIVRSIGDKYEIIAGERRYKASRLIGKETIPAIILNLNDSDSAEVALIENVQRQDLTPIEEAVSIKKILDMGILTQETLANKLGKKQSTISNKLRLLNLHDDVQEALLDELISERHARSLLKLNNDQQFEILKKIIEERLTVRKTDQLIEEVLSGSNINEKETKELETILFDFDIKEIEEKVENMNENPLNPGFMDIEKIENEAKDIIKEEERPNFDFLNNDNLPKPNTTNPIFNIDSASLGNQVQTNVVNNPNVEENNNLSNFEQSPLTENKFFNVENTDDSSKVINEEVPKIEEKNTFNFTFDFPIEKDEPLQTTTSEHIENPNFQTDSEVIEANTDLEQTLTNFQPIEFKDSEQVNNNIQEPVLNQTEKLISTSDSVFNTPTSSEPINQPIINPSPYISNVATTEIKNNNNSDINQSSFEKVINKIKECYKEIEKLGYKIDFDELNLETIYQATMTIEK